MRCKVILQQFGIVEERSKHVREIEDDLLRSDCPLRRLGKISIYISNLNRPPESLPNVLDPFKAVVPRRSSEDGRVVRVGHVERSVEWGWMFVQCARGVDQAYAPTVDWDL